MKNVLTATALLVGTIASANVFASTAQSYDVNIFNLDNEAVVKVTNDGQPVSNVPVQATGIAVNQTLTTSQSGTVFVKNTADTGKSLKISIQEPNGQEFATQRYLASQN